MRTLIVAPALLDALATRLREVLQQRLDPQGPAVVGYEEVETQLPLTQPDMVVVVLTAEPETGLDVLRRARRYGPGCLLAVGEASEPKLILRAMHEGADLFVDEAELESGLETALERMQSKGTAPSSTGRVIAVLASSGGSGSSTLAVNLSAALAKEHERCALLDLKLGRGDLAALLDLKPAFTLADLCLNVSRLDRAMFEKVLVPHSSGIHLIASPQVFGGLRVITARGVEQSLTLARRLFPCLVVDLEDCFHEEQTLVVRQASVLLLVVRLDFTSLRNARRNLYFLEELGIPETRIRLVANRYGQPAELPVAEAETTLGMKITHYVPDDPRTINGANNAGIPAVLKVPSTKVSQSITKIARLVLERRRSDSLASSALLVR
jgi:pilus assembly protein CpaE